MKKILILGSTGMLGCGVSKTINEGNNFEIIYTTRKKGIHVFFDPTFSRIDELPKVDYIINCIGVIKPHMTNGIENAIMINSMFPHQLSSFCKKNGIKLIHITTDCVFSGKVGKYIENDSHDALDDYGKTKSLGECPEKAMILRTSIIGEEKDNFVSLISWAKSMKGKEVNGFSNHYWNGITTDYFGKVCRKIILDGLYEEGLYHVYSSEDVTKLQMMHMFNQKWELDLKIKEIVAEQTIDRTLRTSKSLNSSLNLPSIKKMIEEL